MSRRKPKKGASQAPHPEAQPPRGAPSWWPFAALVLAVLVFYWTPLTSPNASIQWDAVDVHYSPQKYFADRVRAGRLPFWTPYVHCGFPFLADPQVGAWYPLNWPFFLAGITPRTIELELALHALLAGAGAYLLALRLLGSRPAALGAAMLYAFSGYFAGHSSHLGMFQAAACFPWVLLAFLRSLACRRLLYAALTGAAAGMMGLAGHFQTALYGIAALTILATVRIARKPREWRGAVVALAVAGVVAGLLAAVVIVPGLELTGESVRALLDTSASSDGALQPRALGTLVYPNLFGALEGDYTGPSDITQHYFYAGFLLLPLAALGLKDRRVRPAALVLLGLAVWYGFGPGAGLYRIVHLLPGFRSIRHPVNVWFVAALALALLAGTGLAAVAARWPRRALPPILLCALFADLFYWNSAANRLAYARTSFEDLYGRNEATLAQVAAAQPPLTRFMAPDKIMALGPMNGPLDVKLEATYGYNPLELRAYAAYRTASAANPKLVDAMNVRRKLNLQVGSVDDNPGGLPRAYFPRQIVFAETVEESRAALASLRPPEMAVVTSPPLGVHQDGAGRAEIVEHQEDLMRIRCRNASESLLRVAVPYYPGWEATTGGRRLRILRADHAFLGVLVPAGEHEVVLAFHSSYFGLGAALSLAGLAAVAAAVWLTRWPPSPVHLEDSTPTPAR